MDERVPELDWPTELFSLATLCFCGARNVVVENATYVIDGVPACSRFCYEDLLASHHPEQQVVMVSFRKEIELGTAA